MMKKQSITFLVLVFGIFTVAASLSFAINQQDHWTLKKIDEFFTDPVRNFESLKKETDLKDKIELFIRFNLDKVKNGLKILADKPDERKAEIIIFLLSVYPEYIIADEGAKFFCQHPELFITKLESCSNWKLIVTELATREDCIGQAINKLGDSDFEKQIRELVSSVHQKLELEMEMISEFIEDPIRKFDEIKNLEDINSLIYRYEKKLIKDGVLTETVVDRIFKNIRLVDERTIKIIVFLVLNIKTGYLAELVTEKAANYFKDYPDIFLSVLEKTKDWKLVIEEMYSLNPEEISQGINMAKNSRFVNEVKKYIKEIK
ncbi:MAG: hypothetical protein H5U07_02650 [Candidatus Aminicenantes bacterium]|nr:hypothetical protein [Candidatus Aminicenantes bacterium]